MLFLYIALLYTLFSITDPPTGFMCQLLFISQSILLVLVPRVCLCKISYSLRGICFWCSSYR